MVKKVLWIFRTHLAKKNIIVSGTREFEKFFESLTTNNPLKQHIEGAIDSLKEDPVIGNKIEKRLWPKKYIKKHGINNLFRYPLGINYRMIYTILSDSSQINCVILEVLDHKGYDKLFGYKTS
jgi:hypothetical protein